MDLSRVTYYLDIYGGYSFGTVNNRNKIWFINFMYMGLGNSSQGFMKIVQVRATGAIWILRVA